MDPYEAEEFFKLSEPQRSQLLYVRLKNLEHEVAELRVMANYYREFTSAIVEGRNAGMHNPGSGAGPFTGRQAELDYSPGYERSFRPTGRTQTSNPRRAAIPFSLATNSLEHDLRESTSNSNGRPAANDRPLYLQKLMQVDNLCKEEMAKMTAARQNLEPLNQLACDWKLEESEDDGNGGDMEGLSEARMVRSRDKSASEEYLTSLASISKATSALELAKTSKETYGGQKMKDFR